MITYAIFQALHGHNAQLNAWVQAHMHTAVKRRTCSKLAHDTQMHDPDLNVNFAKSVHCCCMSSQVWRLALFLWHV